MVCSKRSKTFASTMRQMCLLHKNPISWGCSPIQYMHARISLLNIQHWATAQINGCYSKVEAKRAVVATYICTFPNTTLFQNEQRGDDAPLPQLVSTKGPKIKHQVAPVTKPKSGATVEVM